jgi:hypothetical protein
MDIFLIKKWQGEEANLRSMIGEGERWVKFQTGPSSVSFCRRQLGQLAHAFA